MAIVLHTYFTLKTLHIESSYRRFTISLPSPASKHFICSLQQCDTIDESENVRAIGSYRSLTFILTRKTLSC